MSLKCPGRSEVSVHRRKMSPGNNQKDEPLNLSVVRICESLSFYDCINHALVRCQPQWPFLISTGSRPQLACLHSTSQVCRHILKFLEDPEVLPAPGVLDVDAAPVLLRVLDVLREPAVSRRLLATHNAFIPTFDCNVFIPLSFFFSERCVTLN